IKRFAHILTEAVADIAHEVQQQDQLIIKARRRALIVPESAHGRYTHYFAFDTLLVFFSEISEGTLIMQFDAFLYTIGCLYISCLAKFALPLRGVVAFTGNYVIDGPIAMVQEVGDCYELEKLQAWSGIIINVPTHRIREWSYAGVRSDDPLIFYDAPLKTGSRQCAVLDPI